MPSVPISLEVLADGQALIAINEAIEESNQDVINNPFNMDPRKVTITYQIAPAKKAGDTPKVLLSIKKSKPGYTMERTAIIRGGVIKIESEVKQPLLLGMEEAIQNNLEKINTHLAESGATLSVVTK